MANRPYGARYEPRPAEQAPDEDVRYQRFLGALQAAGLGSRGQAERAHLPRDLQDLWAPPA